ncbi:MAG: hypothetical protein PHW35_12085 [Lentimicrobiaceae bacterium]|jgi:hypothetical protein|nr:hypothetical protein [Lentimicrobiaceae bacterium]MDD4598697.1 hypothetical protein [Lentimicrobiaceae bacterium]MDY0026527.1 hypothetical protein [Lentimicrobium sp.]HAH57670.1 hypothetical protein [Bacteroidales bacterium]
MKNNLLKILTLLIFIIPVISCVPDEEVEPDGTDPRDKFVGKWLFIEARSAAWYEKASYTVTINKDPSNSAQVLLRNFANVGSSHSAYGVVTNKRITIPTQDVTGGGFVTSGTGNMLTTTTMNWEFSYVTGGDQEFIAASATKQ